MMSEAQFQVFVKKYDPLSRDVGTVFLSEVDRVLFADAVLVDVDCGRTSYGSEVYRKARRRIGLDVDEYAKENSLMDEVHIMQGDSFPLPNACADVVTAQWVVEHVERPEVFLREVARVLKPGGAFVFMTTNIRSPIIRFTSFIPLWIASFIRTKLLHFAHDETFPRVYAMNSPRVLKQLADAHGFSLEVLDRVESFGYFRFSRPLLWMYIRWTQLLRRISFSREMHLVGVFVKK